MVLEDISKCNLRWPIRTRSTSVGVSSRLDCGALLSDKWVTASATNRGLSQQIFSTMLDSHRTDNPSRSSPVKDSLVCPPISEVTDSDVQPEAPPLGTHPHLYSSRAKRRSLALASLYSSSHSPGTASHLACSNHAVLLCVSHSKAEPSLLMAILGPKTVRGMSS